MNLFLTNGVDETTSSLIFDVQLLYENFYKDLTNLIGERTREAAIVKTKLQEASMWSTKACCALYKNENK